ncbi:inositol polyphosphate 1-phosphatase-like [Oculina patagonica]
MAAKKLLQVLLQVSEKSAKIARAWRCQKELFELMVEEKTQIEKNQRFVHDFKTLADVLVQEVVKHDVTQNFPEFSGYIFGEESNIFTNSFGQEIRIEVQEDSSATSKHLSTVLCGNETASHLLAGLIHTDIVLETEETQALEDQLDFELPLNELAIWIDPIDSTAEYMSNSPGEEVDGIVVSGLPCATVLIGVFHRDTGLPVAGVINQPFCTVTQDSSSNKQWSGRRLWGVAHAGHCCYFLGNEKRETNETKKDIKPRSFKIAVSGSESEEMKKNLMSSGAKLYPISGVGHKLLHVIDDNVDFYILSHASSFKWDTCAAHAILCSMGGEVVAYSDAISLKSTTKELNKASLDKCKIKYQKPDSDIGKKWSNINGLIAFKSYQKVLQLLESLI